MTKNEILTRCTWDTGYLGEFTVYSDFFNRDVKVIMYTGDNPGKQLTDSMVKSVNDFLGLSNHDKPLMSELLYKHCLECCEEASYGFDVREGETETAANLREFGISGASDAFEMAGLHAINIEDDEHAGREDRYVKICFYPKWEEEHGCMLVLKNGVLLDHYGGNDAYISDFE